MKGGGSIVARHSSGPRPGSLVAVLTAAALAVVGFFAYQASAGDDCPLAAPCTGASPSPSGEGATDDETGPGGDGPGGGGRDEQPVLPPESGEGERIVYSLQQRRVWLVEVSEDGTGEVVSDTYEVFPSSVDPPVGEYAVISMDPAGTGSDGVPIEHAMVFHSTSDAVVFGFSSALDGSTPDPEAALRTGGVRQTRQDGDAMWNFTEIGTAVVVVP